MGVLGVAGVAIAALGLTSCRSMPAEGRYSTQVYTTAQVQTVADQVYGRNTNVAGQTVDLKLDLFLPPTPGNRPVVILIHGGSFQTGDKSSMAATARGYAVRGYVAVALGYRLDPNASASESRYLAAAAAAIDDGMESVRWLRSKATTYRIDTTRIAMLGSSAGGAIALGVGAMDDSSPGGPLAAYSPKIRAAVSTGATLTPGIPLGLVTFQSTDAPALMYHYATDTVTGYTAAYAKQTCDALVAAKSACTFVQQAGSGHTVSLAASSAQWTGNIGNFLWDRMDLYAIAA